MNCKNVQELLPLYVGRDLEEKGTQTITAHLQSCAECAGAVSEYRETRQLLQQFAPPQFSEAIYDEIRQSVLSEIAGEATVPALSRWLETLFRPRLRWAVATALLLAFAAFALYFIANRGANQTNSQPQVAGLSRTPDGTTRDDQKSQGSAVSAVPSSRDSDGRNTSAGTTIAGPVDRARRSQQRRSAGASVERNNTVAVSTAAARTMTDDASPAGNNVAEPGASSIDDAATSAKTLRMEIQTKDPNIRIIWFAPEPSKQDSPK